MVHRSSSGRTAHSKVPIQTLFDPLVASMPPVASFVGQKQIGWKKLQMARLIKAAQKGHLVTGVVKTAHELGKPSDPRQVGSWNTDKIAKEARKMERELVRQHPELRKLFRMANFVHNVDSLKYYGASRLSEVGSAATRSLGLSATQQAGLQRIGRAGARWLPPLAVGVAGVTIVTSYHQFASGLMKPREFYRMGAGPTILVVFTATGAMVGVVAGGVGAVPGASLGAIVAVPVEVATNWVINRYYRDFDLGQRRLVDAAVEEFYGVVVALVDES